jgi:hypothetical protein
VFDTYGTPLAQYGMSPKVFYGPSGLAFDSTGSFYEADSSEDVIHYFLACQATVATPTPTSTLVPQAYTLRIDVGSAIDYWDKSSDSNLWMADRSFNPAMFGYTVPGQAVTSTVSVTGTTDPLLYQTYRYGNELTYQCTLASGQYNVTLKFMDSLSTAAGMNTFSILAQSVTLVGGLDVYSAVGSNAAYDQTFSVNVLGGIPLTIDLRAVTGQAFLSAIQITSVSPGLPLDIYLVKPGGGVLSDN